MADSGMIGYHTTGGYRIHLAFADGREKTVDFLPWLSGPVFEPVKDEKYFRQFFLEAGTVGWLAQRGRYRSGDPLLRRGSRGSGMTTRCSGRGRRKRRSLAGDLGVRRT